MIEHRVVAETYERRVSHGSRVHRVDVEETLVREIIYGTGVSEATARRVVEQLEWRRDSIRDTWHAHILFRYPIFDHSKEGFQA